VRATSTVRACPRPSTNVTGRPLASEPCPAPWCARGITPQQGEPHGGLARTDDRLEVSRTEEESVIPTASSGRVASDELATDGDLSR
jgi:hypothetical protein